MSNYTIELDPDKYQEEAFTNHSKRLLEVHNWLVNEFKDAPYPIPKFYELCRAINDLRRRDYNLKQIISSKSLHYVARMFEHYKRNPVEYAYPIELTVRGFRPYYQSVRLGRYGEIRTKQPMPVINNYIKRAMIRKASTTQWVLDLEVA